MNSLARSAHVVRTNGLTRSTDCWSVLRDGEDFGFGRNAVWFALLPPWVATRAVDLYFALNPEKRSVPRPLNPRTTKHAGRSSISAEELLTRRG